MKIECRQLQLDRKLTRNMINFQKLRILSKSWRRTLKKNRINWHLLPLIEQKLQTSSRKSNHRNHCKVWILATKDSWISATLRNLKILKNYSQNCSQSNSQKEQAQLRILDNLQVTHHTVTSILTWENLCLQGVHKTCI